jgi:hypothetical protein
VEAVIVVRQQPVALNLIKTRTVIFFQLPKALMLCTVYKFQTLQES